MSAEPSHWHDPKYQPNPYRPIGRRLTPFDHRGLANEVMEDIHMDTLTLQKKRLAYQIEIDRRTEEVAGKARFYQERNLMGNLTATIRYEVWGEGDRTAVVSQVPATWEDALKLGLITVFDNPLINWYVKRHPIQYKEVTASLSVHYPDFSPSLPDHDYVCKVNVMKPFTPEWMRPALARNTEGEG